MYDEFQLIKFYLYAVFRGKKKKKKGEGGMGSLRRVMWKNICKMMTTSM